MRIDLGYGPPRPLIVLEIASPLQMERNQDAMDLNPCDSIRRGRVSCGTGKALPDRCLAIPDLARLVHIGAVISEKADDLFNVRTGALKTAVHRLIEV